MMARVKFPFAPFTERRAAPVPIQFDVTGKLAREQ
jgi:hypothetical protein